MSRFFPHVPCHALAIVPLSLLSILLSVNSSSSLTFGCCKVLFALVVLAAVVVVVRGRISAQKDGFHATAFAALRLLLPAPSTHDRDPATARLHDRTVLHCSSFSFCFLL